MKFKSGEYVWYNDEGWIYLGMDEDGCIHLYRPIKEYTFNLIEFEEIWPVDEDDYDMFLKQNGEALGMKYKRKGININE